ncbi:hypothetical protein N3K66_004488 [Trichothecium roseum]|uniref:Uncharacterized protein n=1 Tax=Trichothecium roseum TaxID=47278 RepID=A0ACC0V373_9HYPO|nr:hypothetical protein N3K66_004488 [Trichothecium roseum]
MEDESCQCRSQGSSASGQPSPGPAAAAPLRAAAVLAPPGPVRRVAAMRKRHSKTRSGCRTCKRRKIKCDEGRPSCRNCTRHSAECDFAQINNTGSQSLPTPSSLAGGNDDNENEERSLPLNLMDLELMHNFTCATYSTLTSDPLVRGVWKTSLVRRAGGCDYLMRAVLAVSAMHLAHQQQHRGGKAAEERGRYLSYGYRQHRVASKRAVAVMMGAERLGPEEAESLWLFSVLTMYFALGSPRSPSTSLLIGEDVLPDWIFLINGCRQLWAAMEDAPRRTGIISPVLKHGGDHWRAVHRPEHLRSDVLDELSRHVDAGARDRPDELRVYRDTIDKLRPQLSSVLARRARRGSGGGGEEEAADISDAFMWSFQVAEEFMPLLRARRQEAVAIYAHSCIILHALEHNRWVQGWADFVMGRAWEMLDEEHRMWIQWPMEEIGWAPPR